MNKKKTLLSLALALLAGGAVAADPVPPARPRANSEVSCLIQPSLEINVGTPVDGVIESVSVDRGDIVNPGQLLARLNAGVESASVDTQAAKAEFGARKRQRNEELQRKQLISTQELDELAPQLPDVPTLRELGIALDVQPWLGLWRREACPRPSSAPACLRRSWTWCSTSSPPTSRWPSLSCASAASVSSCAPSTARSAA